MPFLIVVTIENNKKQMSICPKTWVKNGILHWPKRKVSKKSKIENGLPEKDWSQMYCTLKREFQTYEEAEKELNGMLSKSETEEELGATGNTTKSSKLTLENFNQRAQELYQPSVPKTATVVTNNATYGMINIEDLQPSALKTETAETYENDASCKILNIEDVSYYDYEVIPADNSQLQNQPKFYDDMNSDMRDVPATEITNRDLLANQKLLFDNQIKICKSLAKIDVKIEQLIRNMGAGAGSGPATFVANQQTDNIKVAPIKNVYELQDLENRLRDSEIRKQIKDLYAVFCTPGKKGAVCAYQLIDIFFTREFLVNCSWSGGARGVGTKISIKLFQNILHLFHELVRDCDPSYTVDNNTDFFKNILKNSTKRLNSKLERTSTPRSSSKRKLGKTEHENTCETKGKRTKMQDAGAKDSGNLKTEAEKKPDPNSKQEEEKAQADSKKLKKKYRNVNSNENKTHDDRQNYQTGNEKKKYDDGEDDTEEHENVDMETETNNTDREKVKKETKRENNVNLNVNKTKFNDGQNNEGGHEKINNKRVNDNSGTSKDDRNIKRDEMAYEQPEKNGTHAEEKRVKKCNKKTNKKLRSGNPNENITKHDEGQNDEKGNDGQNNERGKYKKMEEHMDIVTEKNSTGGDEKDAKKGNKKQENNNENRIKYYDGQNNNRGKEKENEEHMDIETEKNCTDGDENDSKKENNKQKNYIENKTKSNDGQNKEGIFEKVHVLEQIEIYEEIVNEKRVKNKTEQDDGQGHESGYEKKYQHNGIEVLQEHVEKEINNKKQEKKYLRKEEKLIKKDVFKNNENKEGGNDKKNAYEDFDTINKPEETENQGENENFDKNNIVDRSGDDKENKSEKDSTDGETDEGKYDDESYENQD